MLSIDEAIEVYKHPTQHFSSEHREADKIAIQSMKKLKAYKTLDKTNFSDGYNKAIDDAKSVILQTIDNEILVDTLHLRLEQLKEQDNE